MEDKIVYVPVSVEYELPGESGTYIVINSNRDYPFDLKWDVNDKIWISGKMKFFTHTSGITHWLKPTPLSELLKEKDEQIKELLDAVHLLVLNYELMINNNGYDATKAPSITKAKSILQKHNSITNK